MISLQRTKQMTSIRNALPWMTAASVFAISYPWFIGPIFQSVQASGRGGYIQALYQERLDRLERMTELQRKQRDSLASWKTENEERLFRPEQAEAFFSGLDRKAASFGCQVVSAEYEILPSPGDSQKDPASPVFMKGAKIHLTGSYGRWIQFLGWVESLPQCVLIDSLKLESVKDRPGILSGRIDLAIPVCAESVRPESADTINLQEK